MEAQAEIKVICNTGNYESTTYSIRAPAGTTGFALELAQRAMQRVLAEHYARRGQPMTPAEIAKRHGIAVAPAKDLGI